MLSIHSDYELMKGYDLFSKLYRSDAKCHEALFGLGRINYVQGRYEIAEKLFIKAYELKRDFVYRVWLGFTQMQMFRVLADGNPNKEIVGKNAFLNLERCTKEVKVSMYAAYALIYLAPELQPYNIKGVQRS